MENKKQEVLGLILARGGSKGIPGKNIKPLNNKPLIAYTIEEALKSKYIRRIIVSTDDKEIARVARSYGAEVPFMRPEVLADDTSASNEAIIHALEWLKKKENYQPDYIVNLQPTSPLRTVEDIDHALEKLFNSKAKSLISVSKTEKSPHWMKTINKDGYLKPFIKGSHKYTRRQDLPEVYELNGAIYIAASSEFIKHNSFMTDKTIAYIMPPERSVDIDNMLDWKLTELMLKEAGKNE